VILEFDIERFCKRLQVREILIDIGGVDNQILGGFADIVDQEIIHDTAIWVAHGAIHDLPGAQRFDIVGDRVAHEILGIRAGDHELAHMGEIEQPDRLTDTFMFFGNGMVLNRHIVAGEFDNLSPELLMDIVKRRFLYH
jgi:hypothetical protein